VCPQHDILFPEMTVLQHLQMFAIFKGVPAAQVHEAAMKMIREVGLKEKTHSQSCMLSGGQKRKLSLGIALIGDSKVIILDEPTSGMRCLPACHVSRAALGCIRAELFTCVYLLY
jgi:ABC-type multidrug transport system ATPase subunit